MSLRDLESSNSNSCNELHYHINLLYSDEDGGWIADIPDLPGQTIQTIS